jgi:hypothetical protein
MKHIFTVSIAVAAIGFLSGSSRNIASDTRSFAYESEKEVGGETVARNGDAISGDMVVGAKHAHYEGRIAADGTIPRLDIRVWRSTAEAKHPRVMSAVVGRDSVQLIEHLGSHVDTLRFGSQPGLLPIINPSIGLSEVVIARARSQHSRSAKIPILLIDALDLDSPPKDKVGAAAATLDVTFLAADTVKIGNGTSTDQMRVIVGSDGRSRGAKAGATAKDKHFSIRPTSKPVPSGE